MIHGSLALRGEVGDWIFYAVPMKYGEVARQFNFAYELGSNKELGQLIQRGISNRTKEITDYLLTSQHRFLGGLVVAAWGGEPQYTALAMDDPEGMLEGLDQGFGVLTFDGTQAYFVLDGQHRLRAIKDAILKDPELAREDICVLIVTHYNSPEGRTRTRRLFSNINKNAKHTGAAENVALDEDDAFAILTRRMVEEHPFLKQDGRVRVILSVTEEGGLKLAAGNVPQTDPKAFTTLTVLFDLLQLLGFDLPIAVRIKTVRPSDEVLDSAYQTLSGRLDDLLKQCGEVQERLEAAVSAREVRAPKNAVGEGHPFMRPVIQKAVARVASQVMQQGTLTWDELTERLSQLPWKMSSAPWTAVFSSGEDGDGGKMLGGKENTVLLDELLHIHLAPPSKQRIIATRKKFKAIRGTTYPVSDEELIQRLPIGEVAPSPAPVVLPDEISNGPEIVLLDESLADPTPA
ncbi:MAG: DGQHR domain-containing protein [Armatimonadetes bacterium]|nr:DGQHR domain-containing protein [Armatimonadota bacterium]